MFTFRRKPKKEPDEPRIRTSPSLPEFSASGIPWPEELVDINAIRNSGGPGEHGQLETESSVGHGGSLNHGSLNNNTNTNNKGNPLASASSSGAAKSTQEPVVLFHKPFRPSLGARVGGGGGGVGEGRTSSAGASVSAGINGAGKISSMFMTAGGTPTFDSKKVPVSVTRYSQRRPRIPSTFNLMVVGGKGTGKTSLLRLLLETADVSPSATADQKAAMERFLKGSTKTTPEIQTACIEICESRFDRVLFSTIDTPGLDFQEGRELKLERQVNTVLKYVDAQYADTMSEESKVVRQSKGDQHIHLCIYMIDPASIMTAEARRALSAIPSKTRSETTVSMRTPPDLVPDTSSGDDDDSDAAPANNDRNDDEDEDNEPLTMSPPEIRVIRRLTARTNVLPVIARADSLTDEKLAAVKNAVRRGLAEAGIDFGVFGPLKKPEPTTTTASTPKRQTQFSIPGKANGNGIPEAAEESEASDDNEDDDGDERQSRPVIKLRPNRLTRHQSRSRSRRDLTVVAESNNRRPVSPDLDDQESVANVRFSARIVAKTDLVSLMPFALIAPEPRKVPRRRPVPPVPSTNPGIPPVPPPARPMSSSSEASSSTEPSSSSTPVSPPPPAAPEEVVSDEGSNAGTSTPDVATSPVDATGPKTSASAGGYSFLQGPPRDLKGQFIRKYRWGTVDVLDPEHCDFAALRTAVLSTHMKLLKIHTKEVLYEKYRTEKLLARRATAHITDEERQRLLEDLGI